MRTIEQRTKSESVLASWIPGPILDRKRRFVVATLSVLAIVLLAGSILFPYWEVTLKAPQYPDGLHVFVYLNKVEGDVSEVDLLNHYIGMKKLGEAAQFERSIALYALSLVSLFTLFFVFSGKKVMSLFALPALGFPIGFLVDLSFWLYHFGHNLNPHAPIRFKPFTPHLLGEGRIGQFATVGVSEMGFYFAIASFIFVVTALILRFTVCNKCPHKEKCSLMCPHLFLWPPQQYREEKQQ
jgi:hypothetical protein